MRYVRTDCEFPSASQGAVLEKQTPKGREHWFILTSLSAKEASAQQLLHWIRNHWQIENGLHHVKDRTLKEDAYEGKNGNVVHCLTIVRNGVVSVFNRLIPPAHRRISRPNQQIRLAADLPATVHRLREL
ncbi:MAG: transposase [Vampirovibrionales bacterium]